MALINNPTIGYTAGAVDLPQYAVVKIAASLAVVTTAITEEAFGVNLFSTDAGDRASIQLSGSGQCLVNGSGTAIAVGDKLSPGAGGKALKHDAVGTTAYFGMALEASTGDGDVIRVLIFDNKRV